MLAIGFRFLAGRYHATPWGHHVNEGAVEWPPSPWRIQRALLAASARLPEAPDEVQLRALLLDVIDGAPLYGMPPWSEGHTRHYMPIRGGKTTKVIDAFVAVGDGAGDDRAELVVAWPHANPTEPQLSLLDALLAQVSYLGRAESWVDARRVRLEQPPSDAMPADIAEAGGDLVDLPVLMSAKTFERWRDSTNAVVSKREQKMVPRDRWEALGIDTARLQKESWSDPPGIERVAYRIRPARRARRPIGQRVVHLAWYQLAGNVLPRVQDTVSVGEYAHRALVALSGRLAGGDAHSVFTGRDESGGIRVDGHQHAHVLPLDLDHDGRIDHLAVWSPKGFDEHAQAVLSQFGVLYGPGGHELRPLLLDFDPGPQGCPLLRSSKTWESRTPFVLTRHPKRRANGTPRLDEEGRWVEGPEWQLQRELSHRGLEASRIDCAEGHPLRGRTTPLPWYRFRRERLHGEGRHVQHAAMGFRLVFPEPVAGPLALGYASHYGLGLFVPVS